MSDISSKKPDVMNTPSNYPDLSPSKIKVSVDGTLRVIEEKPSSPLSDINIQVAKAKSMVTATGRLFSIIRGENQFVCNPRGGIAFDLLNQIRVDVDGLKGIVNGLKGTHPATIGQDFQTVILLANSLYNENHYWILGLLYSYSPQESIQDLKDWPLSFVEKNLTNVKKRFVSLEQTIDHLVSLVDHIEQTQFAVSKGSWVTLFGGMECSAEIKWDRAQLKISGELQAGPWIDTTQAGGLPSNVEEIFGNLHKTPEVKELSDFIYGQAQESGATQVVIKPQIDPQTQTSLKVFSESLHTASDKFHSFLQSFQEAKTAGEMRTALKQWDQWQNENMVDMIRSSSAFGISLSNVQRINAIVTRQDKVGVSGKGAVHAGLEVFPSKKLKVGINTGVSGEFYRVSGTRTESTFSASLDATPVSLQSESSTMTRIENVAPLLGKRDSIKFHMGIDLAERLENSFLNFCIDYSQTHFISGGIDRTFDASFGYLFSDNKGVKLYYRMQESPVFLGDGFPISSSVLSHTLGIGIFLKHFELKGAGNWGAGLGSKEWSEQNTVSIKQWGADLSATLKF